MSGFETVPAAVPEKKSTELSPEDQAVMSRRKFLKAMGTAAMVAAAPEVLAASEKKKENLSLQGFTLTEFQKRSLASKLESLAPGAEAEFTFNGPGEPFGGHRFVWINVTVLLKDGTEKRGKGTTFFPTQPQDIEKIAREALMDAFDQR